MNNSINGGLRVAEIAVIPAKNDLKSSSRNVIAYSGRFPITHLSTKKRSLSHIPKKRSPFSPQKSDLLAAAQRDRVQ